MARQGTSLTCLAFFLLVAGNVLLLAALPFSLRVNITESVPRGLYFLDERKIPRLGDMTVTVVDWARMPDGTVKTLLSKRAPLLKPVGAVAGQFLTTVGVNIWRCADARSPDSTCVLLATAAPFDSRGRPLQVYRFNRTRVPDGFMFLGGMNVHPRSLDSRYIGLVPVQWTSGVAHPLLTF